MIEGKEKLMDYYNRKEVVDSYEKVRFNTLFKKANHEAEISIINAHLKEYANIKLLEIGVGTGRATRNLIFTGKGIGVDSSENMLNNIRKKIYNKKWSFIKQNIFNLNFPKSSFDAVITLRVIRHFDNGSIRKALEQIHNVLKKGGLLIFDMPNSDYNCRYLNKLLETKKKNKNELYESKIPINLLVNELTALGFNIIDIKPIKFEYLRLVSYLAEILKIKWFMNVVFSYIYKKEMSCYNNKKCSDLLIISKKLK